MNSEEALAHVEALAQAGTLVRASPDKRNTKGIIFRTLSGRHFAVELHDVAPPGDAKEVKLVFEVRPRGNSLDWDEVRSIEGIKLTDRQFKSSAYLLKGAGLDPGKQISAYVSNTVSLSRLIEWYSSADASSPLRREAVESAMDIFDRLGPESFSRTYPQFGEPQQFWVRSARRRPHQKYPSKPIASIARGVETLNGGWPTRESAAALLHNTGYIIVTADGSPAQPPDHPHLLVGADRIRACALTNYVAPARHSHSSEVTITAGTLHDEIGLTRSVPNVCQALRGKRFQEIASVQPPLEAGPPESTTTTFTYRFDTRETSMPQLAQLLTPTTNLILYGPPGTGKTYATAAEAVRLCRGLAANDALLQPDKRIDLMDAYHELSAAGRVAFITFHQSFSYEEFVEGLRPTTDTAEPSTMDQEDEATGSAPSGFRLYPRDGLFKQICERARLDNTDDRRQTRLDRRRRVFKVALGRRGEEEDRIAEGLTNGLIHLGWGGKIDWTDERYDDFDEILQKWKEIEPGATGKNGNIEMVYALRSYMEVGDYVVLSDGRDSFSAFGRVSGEYYYDAQATYHPHRRKVEWLWRSADGAERALFYEKTFRRHAIYRLKEQAVDWDALEAIVLGPTASNPADSARPFVLIIDEINRANISSVFGELITLLEPDKRLGAPNELKVRLPYSRETFGVPANLHIIGTMNTADRSIALLDTALRRRFEFRELMPRPSLLGSVDGVDLNPLLTTINDRIEYLFDREHQIGHAYFIHCKTLADVETVMRCKVIPLLAEYFYEDWNKVAAVLGDSDEGDGDRDGRFLNRRKLSAPKGWSAGEAGPRFRWVLREHFDLSSPLT